MPDQTTSLSWEAFFREYGDALTHGTAAVFAGAGLSRAAGYVDWIGLLEDFANDLKLDLKVETDLVSVAQYHVNAEGGVRTRLEQKIIGEFGQQRDLTPAHSTLAALPIDLYWTTNYDNLLEKALGAGGRQADVKSAQGALTTTKPGSDTTVHKLHGDLSDPGNIVITRDDYEEYVEKRADYRNQLQSDLTSRTFLFIGFSFTDPHLSFILSELRRMHRQSPRTHYVLMRREAASDYGDNVAEFEYEANRQAIRVADLKRYGIQTVLVDEYTEIPELLEALRKRYLRRQVFVSGAVHDVEPLGEEWLNEFADALGRRVITKNYNLVSGFGAGVGSQLVFGALQELYSLSNPRIDKRLLLRPFPQVPDGDDRKKVYTEYRESMLAPVGFAIFVAGNRASGDTVENSPGVMEEFEIATTFDAYPLPIGASGWAAADIWNEVNADLDRFFPKVRPPQEPWEALGDVNTTPAQAVDALMTIMDALRPS